MFNKLFNKLRRRFKRGGQIDAEAIMKRADICMQEKKLFLRKDLSIHDLCVEIGTNRTYLSLSIKSRGVNFYDYINRYRVNYFYSLLSDFSNRNVILIDLAEQSGFNSLRTLNRYVKSDFGITVSSLRKEIYTKNASIVLSDSGNAKTATLS